MIRHRAGAGAPTRRDAMKRSRMARGSVRVGAKAAKRRREGGPRALGRDSATVAEYRTLRERLIVRSGSWCEVHGAPCHGSQICHVVKRSQGGADTLTNTFWGCGAANSAMDAAYSTGRLTMIHLVVGGVSVLDYEFVRAANKFDYQRGIYDVLAAGAFKTEIMGNPTTQEAP